MKLLKINLLAAFTLLATHTFAYSGGEKTNAIQLDLKQGLFEISLDDEQELDQVEKIKPFLNITELLEMPIEEITAWQESISAAQRE